MAELFWLHCVFGNFCIEYSSSVLLHEKYLSFQSGMTEKFIEILQVPLILITNNFLYSDRSMQANQDD